MHEYSDCQGGQCTCAGREFYSCANNYRILKGYKKPHEHVWLNGLNDPDSQYVYCGDCGTSKFKEQNNG